jgi:O-Antigen ligase
MTPRLVSVVLTLFTISIPVVGWAVEAGVALTASHILGLCLLLLAGVTWLRRRPPLPKDLAVVSTMAFVLVAGLSVLHVQLQPDIQLLGESAHLKSIKQLVGLVFGTSVFIALYSLLRWYDLGMSVLRTHYWTTVAVGLAALMQYGVALVDMTLPLANFPVHNSTLGGARPLSLMYGFPRISLTLVEPAFLGTYLLTGWSLWLFAQDHPPFPTNRGRRWFLWSGLVLSAAVVITGSRLAYVVCGTLILGGLIARPHRVRRAGLVALGVVLGILLTGASHSVKLVASLLPSAQRPAGQLSASDPGVTVPPAPSQPGSSMLTAMAEGVEGAAVSYDVSVQQRTASYLVAMRLVRDHPFLGTGFGTSSFYMERDWPASFLPLPPERVAGPTMMSHYATIASETGLLGVFCLTGVALAVLLRIRELARGDANDMALAWGVGAAVGSYYLSGLAAALVVYQILLVWLLLATALAVGHSPTLRLTR